MATETEWHCPICQDAQDDFAYALPCGHKFCLGCILCWTITKPDCPLCGRQMETLRFPMLAEDDCQDYVILSISEELPDDSSQEGRAPDHPAENSPQPPVVSPLSSPQGLLSPAEQRAAETDARATVGGLLPEVWAELFQSERHLLNPVLPWLHQELEQIHEARWWEVNTAESVILYGLCIYGPDEELLVQRLQDCFEEHAAPLVHGIVDIIVRQCSEEAQRLLRFRAAGEEDDSCAAGSSFSSSSCTSSWVGTPTPNLVSSRSPPSAHVEEEAGMSEATLCRSPERCPSVPIPAEQEQLQEELGEAAAGPSAQGCSRRCSTPSQDRDRSRSRPQRPPKRRAPGPQDSPSPCKRPPHQQH
ncbi:TOPRS ligase, partial [Corythaixoides concolor]|nr:TOPRS ligase [Corythaixoides concolor]